jgi:Bacteriophage tail sheath protein
MADYAKKAPGVYVEQVASGTAPIAGVGTSTAGFVGVVPDKIKLPGGQEVGVAKVGEVRLVTNFSEFKAGFGDFSADPGQSALAHAVYGFFANGGTRCYVTRVAPPSGGGTAAPSLTDALELLEPIDEIAIVAAPGVVGDVPYADLRAHCERMATRVAVLDTAETVDDFGDKLGAGGDLVPPTSEYMALYFPWLEVYDPATKATKFVPPSGHVAGIYSRVDARRGVHKAPANESVLGAVGLRYAVSAAKQDGLNAHGVNCIRRLGGDIKVWGARTVGGDANLDFKYVNVRRLFNYLRASIDQGTQWAVFEPNDPALWAKITRNVSAFLTNVWAAGGLFGEKAEQAFYVKCDAETNPPALRELGQVTAEVGVAITRPAEFVVFKLGQKAAG